MIFFIYTELFFSSTQPDVTIATHINDKALKEIKMCCRKSIKNVNIRATDCSFSKDVVS